MKKAMILLAVFATSLSLFASPLRLRSEALPERWLDRCSAYLCSEAARRGAEAVYISTNAEGLYERYGGTWIGMMRDMNGEPSRVYKMEC